MQRWHQTTSDNVRQPIRQPRTFKSNSLGPRSCSGKAQRRGRIRYDMMFKTCSISDPIERIAELWPGLRSNKLLGWHCFYQYFITMLRVTFVAIPVSHPEGLGTPKDSCVAFTEDIAKPVTMPSKLLTSFCNASSTCQMWLWRCYEMLNFPDRQAWLSQTLFAMQCFQKWFTLDASLSAD